MRVSFATITLGTTLAMLGTSGACAYAADPPLRAPALTGPQVGDAAPPFVLKTIDGITVRNATYRGRTLVLNVWATWCPPCRLETPDLIASATKLQKEGVAFLGVDTTEDASLVRAFVTARNVPYAQALDADKSFSKAYDVAYFPTTYVIDPHGVLRARYIDVLGTAQLAALVQAAKGGRNGEVASPLQSKIDATLADPAIVFTGDTASVEANAKRALAAIGTAESLLDESDAAKGNPTDLLRTRVLEATLRERAIAALIDVGTSVADTTLLPRLRGDAARDRERWSDALDAYRAVLAIEPKNVPALAGVAFAAGRLDQFDDALAADTALAAIDPTDVGALVDLARAQAKAGRSDDAYATFARAHATALAQIAANPGKAGPLRMAAYAHLYAGRVYAKNGDVVRARAEFERSLAVAVKLPSGDSRHDMYLEENQEAIVALGLTDPKNGATVSLAPWTGPELPGSIPNTAKFRLVVAGTVGRSVALRSSNVPRGWVASFCTDRVCAPFKTTVSLPPSGVKIIEFQLVAPDSKSSVPKVRVTGRDGEHESAATT